jgi:hypothetical protein
MNKLSTNFSPDQFIMYLRKSRQDDPNETIEEVLSKHETILQEYMEREYGFRIAEENIYREVCSGESIESREEIKKVLAKCESTTTLAVVVVEPQRLSRGDLIDCGTLVQHLRYTKTLVVTPVMTYNLENKMERKFFQDELLRGNDYLEYTKEILFRGRVAAVKRGNYIHNFAPYGYDRIKIGKDYTLTPNENAKYVKLIFEWFIEGESYNGICEKLTALGAPTIKGGAWDTSVIRGILDNKHYLGKVVYCATKETIIIVEGKKKKKTLPNQEENIIIVEGKHPAIISDEVFERAQERRKINIAKNHKNTKLLNPLSTILYCKKCGYAMRYDAHRQYEPRFMCISSPQCYKSAKTSFVIKSIINALEKEELPYLESLLKSNKINGVESHKTLISSLEKQLTELNAQEEKQYELLEKGVYSEEVFEQRNKALKEKRVVLKKQIEEVRTQTPKAVDYLLKMSNLKKAIAALKNVNMPAIEKNKILKAIIKRIEYSCDSKTYDFGVTNIKLDIFLNI